ncbi:MAG: hypothetical protein K2X93_13170 [Candidatus Obscuribacterales bacterium]|nr:hypothetical protein [Candidatus Obscuribacterales bacterium]
MPSRVDSKTHMSTFGCKSIAKFGDTPLLETKCYSTWFRRVNSPTKELAATSLGKNDDAD